MELLIIKSGVPLTDGHNMVERMCVSIHQGGELVEFVPTESVLSQGARNVDVLGDWILTYGNI